MSTPSNELPDDFDSNNEEMIADSSMEISPHKDEKSSPPKLIAIEEGSSGISAIMHINLQPYVDSREKGDLSSYQAYRDALNESVSAVNGPIYFDELVEAAFSRSTLPKKTQMAIKQSAAYVLTKGDFVEEMKNTMDEAILGHYEEGKDAVLDLQLDIELTGDGNIHICTKDNGRGYPQAFLDNIDTPEHQEAYMIGSGSVKRDAQPERAELFGGFGKGKRNKMALVMHGAIIKNVLARDSEEKARPLAHLTPIYEKLPVSQLRLCNGPSGHGAETHITTSLASLRPIKEAMYEDDRELKDLFTSMVPKVSASGKPEKMTLMERRAVAAAALKLAATNLRDSDPEDTEPRSTPHGGPG